MKRLFSFITFFVFVSMAAVPAWAANGNPSPWAAAEVNSAINAGLVPENLQGDYTSPATRGEVAGMFVRLLEKSSGQTIDALLSARGATIDYGAFSDTADEAVLAMNALGIIQGVGGGKFSPDGTLTRAEIAAILNRVARVLGVDTTGYPHNFTDVNGHWVDAELGWPAFKDVIKGVGGGRFDPEGQLTVEQAILITYRALNADKAPPVIIEDPIIPAAPGEFDWVDISTTYEGILRPYAESDFECEYRVTTGTIHSEDYYYFYFTKDQTRIAVSPIPASNCYGVIVGKPDDSNGMTRIEAGASVTRYTTTEQIKAVLLSVALAS